MSILSDLKERKKGWEESLIIRQAKKKVLVIEFKNKELELKRIKHFIYITDKEIREAKYEIKFYSRKIIWKPNSIRKWNIYHQDKVFDFVMNGNLDK